MTPDEQLLLLIGVSGVTVPPNAPTLNAVDPSTLSPTITGSMPAGGAPVEYFILRIYNSSGLVQESGRLLTPSYPASTLFNKTGYSAILTAYNTAGSTDSDSATWTTDYYTLKSNFTATSAAGNRDIAGEVATVTVVDPNSVLPTTTLAGTDGVIKPTAITASLSDIRNKDSFPFTPGLLIKIRVRYESSVSGGSPSTERSYLAINGSTSAPSATNPTLRLNAGSVEVENTQASGLTYVDDTWYDIIFVTHGTGGYDAFFNGHYLYHNRSLNSTLTALYAHVVGTAGRLPFTVDYIQIRPLPEAYQQAWWFTTVNQNPPTPTTLYDTGFVDGQAAQAINFPAGALAGEVGVGVRYDSSNNGYDVYFDSSGNLKWRKVTAGTPGSATTMTPTFAVAGDVREITVVVTGTTARVFTRRFSAGVWGLFTLHGTFTISSFTSNEGVRAIGDSAFLTAGGSLGRLIAMPTDSPVYTEVTEISIGAEFDADPGTTYSIDSISTVEDGICV